jgi:hypothetical protein
MRERYVLREILSTASNYRCRHLQSKWLLLANNLLRFQSSLRHLTAASHSAVHSRVDRLRPSGLESQRSVVLEIHPDSRAVQPRRIQYRLVPQRRRFRYRGGESARQHGDAIQVGLIRDGPYR